jgi:REP element-mobilizing transposase RayT
MENRRRPLRLVGYDYSRPGGYFLTICARQRRDLFGQMTGSKMLLSDMGKIVETHWQTIPSYYTNVELDEMVLMPDHLHGIIHLIEVPWGHVSHALPKIVQGFKAFSTRTINALRESPGEAVWQRGYYDRIIRNEKELSALREYIRQNPVARGLRATPVLD